MPNKQALSLTVSRVLLLLLPSHCSPYPLPSPLPLTPLPSFNIRLLFSWFVVQLVPTHPSHLTDSPFYLSYRDSFLFLTPCTLLSPLLILSSVFAFYYVSLQSSSTLMLNPAPFGLLDQLFRCQRAAVCVGRSCLEMWRISVPWSLPAEARLYQ